MGGLAGYTRSGVRLCIDGDALVVLLRDFRLNKVADCLSPLHKFAFEFQSRQFALSS